MKSTKNITAWKKKNLFSHYFCVYITLLIVIKYGKLKVLYLNRLTEIQGFGLVV